MINTRIAYTQEDGSVAIVCPSPEFIAQAGTIEKLARCSMPLGTHFEVLDVADIPTDRYFRNAWRLGEPLSQSIETDMPAAREIHMDALRKLRNKKLEELDIPYTIAFERRNSGEQETIGIKKQALRDMPASVDLSSLSEQELKNYMPDILSS
tara:strand:- start:1242 stop:1700 length:459 start_codon:yes stop_codon:yes gene_type:complete